MDANDFLLQQEQAKCVAVINNYNSKYNTIEHKRLRLTLEYLIDLLEKEKEDYKKNILIEDISIIKSYLM
jgi:hypothetical protein